MTTIDIIKALRISDIDMHDITIGTKKTNKTVPISINGKPLVFQTPFLKVVGTLKKTQHPTIFQLDTLFEGDTQHKNKSWFQFVENLESRICDLIINNNVNWFTQNDVNIKSLIREYNHDDGTFYIKWPISLKENIFLDEDKKQFDPSCLKDKDCVKLIIEISYLWVTDNNCGLAAIVQKVLVKPYIEKITNEYVFDDSESEESDIDDNNNNIISLLATEQKIINGEKNQQDDFNTGLEMRNREKNRSQITATSVLNNSTNYHSNPTNKKQNNHILSKKMSPKNTVSIPQKSQKVKVERNLQPDIAKKSDKKQNQTNSKIINKATANPFQNTKYVNKCNDDFSDLSDEYSSDNINGYGKQNMIHQLINEYSPSSNEINDDDLDMD